MKVTKRYTTVIIDSLMTNTHPFRFRVIFLLYFLQLILRSDESYAQKKGFKVMFTVNGDGSGQLDSDDVTVYENDVIKNEKSEKEGMKREQFILKDKKYS